VDLATEKPKSQLAEGKELFTHKWVHSDRRSHAGDGLGPVFNAQSCVACHKQGSVGGAGSREDNASFVTVFVEKTHMALMGVPITEILPDYPKREVDKAIWSIPPQDKLVEIHPLLLTQASFPYHRFGAGPDFTKWKESIFSKGIRTISDKPPFLHTRPILVGDAILMLIESQRNAPALFGAGLIDAIPDQVLVEVAAEQAKQSKQLAEIDSSGRSLRERELLREKVSLPVRGRVARLKDSNIGRFGWKGNVATLREFTLQACSNELGLEVPGVPRAAPPWKKNYKAPGNDLTIEQCEAMVAFIAALPRPVVRRPETPQQANEIENGHKLFASIGCAACHREKLGEIEGIYSDLLLHDMGPELSGSGSYAVISLETASKDKSKSPPALDENRPASEREWRTPPLWGLRDSAPYLHDGQANTIADAVSLHGGEGLASAQAFANLKPEERRQIEQFLQSLAAPSASE
jgi:CxxC motif-containing protein (DUF1111 family)